MKKEWDEKLAIIKDLIYAGDEKFQSEGTKMSRMLEDYAEDREIPGCLCNGEGFDPNQKSNQKDMQQVSHHAGGTGELDRAVEGGSDVRQAGRLENRQRLEYHLRE